VKKPVSILRAAAVQFRSRDGVAENCARICDRLARLAEQGVHVAVFPECALTAYDNDGIIGATPEQLATAEHTLAKACEEHRINAVVGTPFFRDGRRYNGAIAWNRSGTCVARYAKIHTGGEKWFVPGEEMALFPIEGVLCTAIICFDSRFPELVRLPVMAGAQVVFYLSCETDIIDERRMDQYRAQLVARAVENSVYVVCANSPMGEVRVTPERIHGFGRDGNGRSRIISPDGVIVKEASVFGEETVAADLVIADATRHLALLSKEFVPLGNWWDLGVKILGDLSSGKRTSRVVPAKPKK